MTIKEFDDCENIHSVNTLYLIIHSATVHFKEKNNEIYLFLAWTEKYEEVWSGIRSEIKTLNNGKELFYKKTVLKLELILMMLTFKKPLKFPALAISIRCIFQER